MTINTILKKINDLDEAIQSIKLSLFFKTKNSVNSKLGNLYDEDALVDEVRKVRQKSWKRDYISKV